MHRGNAVFDTCEFLCAQKACSGRKACVAQCIPDCAQPCRVPTQHSSMPPPESGSKTSSKGTKRRVLCFGKPDAASPGSSPTKSSKPSADSSPRSMGPTSVDVGAALQQAEDLAHMAGSPRRSPRFAAGASSPFALHQGEALHMNTSIYNSFAIDLPIALMQPISCRCADKQAPVTYSQLTNVCCTVSSRSCHARGTTISILCVATCHTFSHCESVCRSKIWQHWHQPNAAQRV